jgi:hypothetical protein
MHCSLVQQERKLRVYLDSHHSIQNQILEEYSSLSQKGKSSIAGPLAIACGGVFIVFPILSYIQLMFDGRLSFPYQDTASGMMAMVCLFVFLGLLVASMGLQMILEERR